MSKHNDRVIIFDKDKLDDFITLIDCMGTDARVVNAARVSFHKSIPETSELTQGDKGLIKYLAQHGHVSPFFHPQVCFRLKMPIWMAREWFRHTVGLTRNEVSRRYVDEDVVCMIPSCIRERNTTKKQGSSDNAIPNNYRAMDILAKSAQISMGVYRGLLEEGAAPEVARNVLPQCMMTEFIETGSLAAYARIYNLRDSPDAQHEIRMYAKAIGDILVKRFPVSWQQLTNHHSLI
jgi:thymidylate synthase (FAD)